MARRSVQSPGNAMMNEIVKVLQGETRYAVAARRIDDIERRYLPTVPEDERLDVQRSASRMALIAATDKGASFVTVSKRFRARCALGFEDVFSESAVLVDFAYACAGFCKRRVGLQVLGQAQERLDGSGMKPRSAFARQLSRLIEQCRCLLEGGEAG